MKISSSSTGSASYQLVMTKDEVIQAMFHELVRRSEAHALTFEESQLDDAEDIMLTISDDREKYTLFWHARDEGGFSSVLERVVDCANCRTPTKLGALAADRHGDMLCLSCMEQT